VPHSSVRLLLGFSAMLSISLVSRVNAIEVCTIICLGVNRHMVSGHEISRLQHGLQLIMARHTRIINCRPCCNLYNHILLYLAPTVADLGMFSMFGRTGAPQKRAPQRGPCCLKF